MRAVRFVLALTMATVAAGCTATSREAAREAPGPQTAQGQVAQGQVAQAPGARTALPAATRAALNDFAGAWAGHTEKGAAVERAATLLVEPDGSGGFTITWASFEAGEQPGSVEHRQRSMTFRPSAEPGIWLAQAPTPDPFAHLAGWAQIDGRTLRIDTLGLRPDGRLERQVYERTLENGDALSLTYRRFVEDELRRTVEAGFLRL